MLEFYFHNLIISIFSKLSGFISSKAFFKDFKLSKGPK